MQVQQKSPEFLTDNRITAVCAYLTIAGSDSTVISLADVFHYILESPDVYKNLLAKTDAADASGDLEWSKGTTGAGDVVPFPADNKLRYLDAITNESFRMHPAAGLLLERVTPP